MPSFVLLNQNTTYTMECTLVLGCYHSLCIWLRYTTECSDFSNECIEFVLRINNLGRFSNAALQLAPWLMLCHTML